MAATNSRIRAHARTGAARLGQLCAVLFVLILIAKPALGWQGQELLDAARDTVGDFRDAEKYPAFPDTLRGAKAVVIVPRVSIFSLIFFEYATANAVLMVRDPTTRRWGDPAFMTISTQQFKFQPHTEMVAIAFAVMTNEVVERLLSGSTEIGMDMSVADGNRGDSVTDGADIIEFVGGGYEKITLPLSDATVSINKAENESYYGHPPVLRELVLGVEAEGATALRASLKVD